jgi:hypothetical protein
LFCSGVIFDMEGLLSFSDCVWQELRQQIEVVRLDLHAVEPRIHRVARGAGVVGDGPADLVTRHRPRRDGGHAAGCRDGYLFGIDVGGRERQLAAEEIRVRYSAGVPELGDDAAAGGVDSFDAVVSGRRNRWLGSQISSRASFSIW